MAKKKRSTPPPKPLEQPATEPARQAEKTDDLFVSLGNLGNVSIAHMREVLDRNDATVMSNYENLVEDFIETFNHAVTQGVPPEWALFAFTQAYAITMGQCLRADLPFSEGGKFIRTIIENADLANKLVRQVSILTPGGTKQ